MIPLYKKEFIKDALFISYTGLKDFLACPRAYYLKNRYKNPKTGNRIQITAAALTLGALVHDALKWYLQTNRLATKDEVIKKFRNHWLKYRGKKGGFVSTEQEAQFGKRGLLMIDNFFTNKEALEKNLPAYDFLKFKLDEKIILNGRLDFVGQLPKGGLHVLDFKTGAKDEDDPLQLEIYAILAEANLGQPVLKVSFWYLDRDNLPKEATLSVLEERVVWLQNKGQEIEKLLKEDNWVCIGGDVLCKNCQDYQAIIAGQGEFLFSDSEFRKDIYFLDKNPVA